MTTVSRVCEHSIGNWPLRPLTLGRLHILHYQVFSCPIGPRSAMRNDSPRGWASSVDSLYDRAGVMSSPRALKPVLIAALKIITKQQEAADVSGQCAEDRAVFREISNSHGTENIDPLKPDLLSQWTVLFDVSSCCSNRNNTSVWTGLSSCAFCY